MPPNTLEDISATSFCNQAERPRLRQFPVLLLASIMATCSITALAEKDIAIIAEEAVERLDNAVSKTNEDLLKKELKEQSEGFIELELENEALQDQLKELQQDITRIRTQNSAYTPVNNQKTLRVLMEKQNQINALEKQIKEYQSSGNLIPVKIPQPKSNARAKLLKEENEMLMAKLDQQEEENFKLEKRIQKISAFYESQYIEKLNTPSILPTDKRSTPRTIIEPESISIFDETKRSKRVQYTEKIKTALPDPNKRLVPNVVDTKSSKFDSLISEKVPPAFPIQPVESKKPVLFDVIKNASAKTVPPNPVPTSLPVTEIIHNVATTAESTPAATARIKAVPVSFDVLKSSSNKPDSPAILADQQIPPSTTAKTNLAPISFDVLKSSSNKPGSPATLANQQIHPSTTAKHDSAPVSFDVLKRPSIKSGISIPDTSTIATIETSTPVPESPVIATMFQLWTSDIEYESLLPPKQPAPSVGIDLLGQRLAKTSTPIGLDGYDIPGSDNTPSVKQDPVQEPSIPVATTPLVSVTTDSGILETLHDQETAKNQDSIDDTPAITQTEGATKVPNPENKKSTNPNSGTLLIEANVAELKGRITPAYHTEFFITTQDLTDILSSQPELKEEIDREITGKNISSYAELWARAQKYGYNYPGLAAKIRNALKEAGGHRIRTDANGQAKIELQGEAQLKGERYIVGVSPLGTVGVVWSKRFYIQEYALTKKPLSLEIKDAIWLQ